MARLCYSCMPSAIVDDAKAAVCPREHCTARADLEREARPQGTRPPKANDDTHPTFHDEGA